MARHLNNFCKFAPSCSRISVARREIHNNTFVSCESLKKSGQFFKLGQSMAHSACVDILPALKDRDSQVASAPCER